MVLNNKYAYNVDFNIWYILFYRGIHFDRETEYTFDDNILKLIFHLSSDYEDEYFFKCVYDSIDNVKMYYGYEFLSCHNLGKYDGKEKKYIYEVEIRFKI